MGSTNTMPLSENEVQTLFDSLQRHGWRWRGDFLYAPNDQFWLHRDHPWTSDLHDFRVRMVSRLYDGRDSDANVDYLKDIETLVNSLEEMCDDGGLQQFFLRMKQPLEQFAGQYHLLLKKFPWSASWQYLFQHPKGGVGYVAIERIDDETVEYPSCWWYDDFDCLTRFIRHHTSLPKPAIIENVFDELTLRLKQVLDWPFGTWDRSADDAQWNRNYKSKAEFDFETVKKCYPVPKY